MTVCPNCKQEIQNDGICPYCGYGSIIEGDIISEITEIKEEKQEGPFFQNDQTPTPSGNQGLNSVLKIIILVLIVVLPGVGPIVGIIGGVILLSNAIESNRSFGIKMIVFSIVMLLVNIAFCCLNSIFGFFNFLGNL